MPSERANAISRIGTHYSSFSPRPEAGRRASGQRVPSLPWLLWPIIGASFVVAELASLASSTLPLMLAQGDAPSPPALPNLGPGATIVGGGATLALIVNAVAPLIGKWLENRHTATMARIAAEKARHDEQREEYEREVASVLREFRESLDGYARWMHGFYNASVEALAKPAEERSADDLPVPPPLPAPSAPEGEFVPRLPESVWAKSRESTEPEPET